MNLFINYLKILLIPVGVAIFFPLIISLFNIMGFKTNNIIITLVMIITMLISGFIIGRKVNKKGYINGLILGLLVSLILFLLSLFFKNTYQLRTILYYMLLIFASILGSMFGINKKRL